MNKVLKKHVELSFEKLIADNNLDYKKLKAGLPFRTAFSRQANDDLTLLLLIHFHSYANQFALDVGWIYKSSIDRISSHIDPTTAMQKDEVVIGLTAISDQKPKQWWKVMIDQDYSKSQLDINSTVFQTVKIAFESLLSHGIPYLKQIEILKTNNNSK